MGKAAPAPGKARWGPAVPSPSLGCPRSDPGLRFFSSDPGRPLVVLPARRPLPGCPLPGDRCPTSPQATPGHATAPPGPGAVFLGQPGPVRAGARRPPQSGGLLAEPAAPPPARRRVALAGAQPAAAAGRHGPGGHSLRAVAQLLRRASAPHVSEGPRGGAVGGAYRRGGALRRGGSPQPRCQSGVGWAGLGGSCAPEAGRNWEGRCLRGGERVGGVVKRSGRSPGGIGEPCSHLVCQIFPPSRWTHRWQNINYQFLGKRKRHLVPLRP